MPVFGKYEYVVINTPHLLFLLFFLNVMFCCERIEDRFVLTCIDEYPYDKLVSPSSPIVIDPDLYKKKIEEAIRAGRE